MERDVLLLLTKDFQKAHQPRTAASSNVFETLSHEDINTIPEFWKPEGAELPSGATLGDADAHKLGADTEILMGRLFSATADLVIGQHLS